MATIPIRDVPGEAVEPSGNELILIDNGIAMQKATINDAVKPKATEIADQKIADLNLGTASQANVEDFATAEQGGKADSALQPTDIGTSVQAHGDFLDDLAAMDPGSAGQVIAFDPDGKPIPVDAGSGDMLKSVYDPDENSSNAFDLSNQYGSKPTDFPTVADLLADTSLGYSAARKADQVAEGDIIEAQGFRYEVAASDAEDAHVETAGEVKAYAASRTVYDPRQFGIPHESTDVEYVTQQWQKLLDFAGGAWIDGGRRLYEIDRIFGHSHQRIRNVRFKKTASDQDSNAALTFASERWISGPTPPEPLRDIVLEDIEVDGNRDFQTNILAAEEDGGRHCIAIYGRVHDLTLRRVFAHHAATDGVCVWSGYNRAPVYEDRVDNDFCFRDILFEDCRFTWNGRCGYSIDAVDQLTSINGKYNDNGRDTKDTDPLDLDDGKRSSYGSRARRFPSTGLPFGRGFFWEDYGLGSSFANILSIGDQCHRNAQGFLIHSALLSDDWQLPGYSPRGPFKVVDIDIDEALNVSEHGQPLQNFPAISIYAQNSSEDMMPFRDIRISGRIAGQILLRGVKGFNFDGDMKLSVPYFAKVTVRDVSDATFNMNKAGAGVIVNAVGDPIWYHPTISGGGNTTDITSTTPREIDISGPYVLKYRILATAVSGGIVSLTFSPPAEHVVEVLSASAVIDSTGAAIAVSIVDETVAIQGAEASQVTRFTVTVAVRPN